MERLRERGLEARIVANRLNRRKIDIIPVPEWTDPKKADIGRLLEAVMARLAAVDMTDLSEVVDLAAGAAALRGWPIPGSRATSST